MGPSRAKIAGSSDDVEEDGESRANVVKVDEEVVFAGMRVVVPKKVTGAKDVVVVASIEVDVAYATDVVEPSYKQPERTARATNASIIFKMTTNTCLNN
ncbi:hypothetical protein ACFLRF_01115 [Candidatus Altiarchaeota archaeon]